jgi:N-acetylmuramoyl-L-alanine amidase
MIKKIIIIIILINYSFFAYSLDNNTPFPGQSKWSLSKIKQKKHPVFTVVLDAGHGGKDSGAKGKSGILEKQVVLAVAKRLRTYLNQLPGMRVILTREKDYFIPLRTRLNIARRARADLFIAIHADGYFDRRARGVSVYALSTHGATSEAARWLAKKDNYAELGGIELSDLQDDSVMLRSVLIDLAQTATIQDSLRLGNQTLAALKKITRLHQKQVEQARFVVLKSPDIPSILVEVGFISHPEEEKRLASAIYQDKLAKALAAGIQQYKKHAILANNNE